MAWTTPKTWATGELVTANDLNLQVRDNFLYVTEKPNTQIVNGSGTDFTTSSTTYVDVPSFTAVLPKAQANTKLLILFRGIWGGGTWGYIGFNINGVDYDYTSLYTNNIPSCHYMAVTGISAGTITVKMRYRTTNGAYSTTFSGGTYRQMIVLEGSI